MSTINFLVSDILVSGVLLQFRGYCVVITVDHLILHIRKSEVQTNSLGFGLITVSDTCIVSGHRTKSSVRDPTG